VTAHREVVGGAVAAVLDCGMMMLYLMVARQYRQMLGNANPGRVVGMVLPAAPSAGCRAWGRTFRDGWAPCIHTDAADCLAAACLAAVSLGGANVGRPCSPTDADAQNCFADLDKQWTTVREEIQHSTPRRQDGAGRCGAGEYHRRQTASRQEGCCFSRLCLLRRSSHVGLAKTKQGCFSPG
jgi:hypothetical protein